MAGTDSSSPLGVGVIGAGSILPLHAVGFLSLPELARLVAVSDLDRDRAEAARRRFGFLAAYESHKELLAREDVQVVAICTRPNVRTSLIRDALDAGKHVLCEKPLAHTLAGADEIIGLCDDHPGSKLGVMYQWRWDPAVRRLRSLVERDRLGRLLTADLQIRAQKGPRYYEGAVDRESFAVDGGGVLMVVGIHQLDLLLTFLGEPEEVSARMDTFLKPTEGEDAIVGWVRFRSGALATVHCTSCAHRADFGLDVQGADASVTLHGRRQGRPPADHACSWTVRAQSRRLRWELLREGRRAVRAPPEPPRALAHARARWRRLRGKPFVPPSHWWHGPAIRDFLESVRADRDVSVPPREARRSLELAVALYQSALSGGPVKLPLDAESPCYQGVSPSGPGWSVGG